MIPDIVANIAIRLDMFCFANMITGAVILPMFQTIKGNTLLKSLLQDKIASDEELWQAVIDEYNNNSNEAYGCHAHNFVPR